MIPAPKQSIAGPRKRLRIHRPTDVSGHVRYWRINGYLASIRCWSDQEFQMLTRPPQDAVLYPEGVWVQLEWASETKLKSQG